MQKIRTKAKAHGVFNSTNGEIIYVDPDHENERHHSPLLIEADARAAFERGLIEDPAKARTIDDEGEGVRDPNAIGTVSAERTADFAKVDGDDKTLPSGSDTLDSRSSTAWPDRERVEGGAEGFTDGIRPSPADAEIEIDTDSGDEDAAPAPKRTRRAST